MIPTEQDKELDEILGDWEFEVFGTPKHWDKTTDRLELDAKLKQSLLDWHNKQVEQAYSDGFMKASKGAFKSQQAAKREAVEEVLDRLEGKSFAIKQDIEVSQYPARSIYEPEIVSAHHKVIPVSAIEAERKQIKGEE